jgi:hypothetical protein
VNRLKHLCTTTKPAVKTGIMMMTGRMTENGAAGTDFIVSSLITFVKNGEWIIQNVSLG